MALLLLAFGWSTTTRAQAPTTAFQVERYEPLPAQGINLLNVALSEVVPHLQPTFGLALHYVDDPLVLVDSGDHLVERVIGSELVGELSAGLGLFDYVEVGLVFPMALYQSGDRLQEFGLGGTTMEGFAAGDLRFLVKGRLLRPHIALGFGIALQAVLYIPTGDSGRFHGDDYTRFLPQLIIDWRHAVGVTIAANIGYQLRPERTSLNYRSDDSLRWGVAVEVPTWWDELKVLAVLHGDAQLASNVDPVSGASSDDGKGSPMEVLAGFKVALPYELALSAGAGGGIGSGVGSPDYRIFLNFGYSPRSLDSDGDGLRDSDDGCRLEPEDLDGNEDTDGCPDPDNDGDGIPDAKDKCPDDAEDKDKFQDKDGCPDVDDDNDGIPDVEDKCRLKPEDKDGFQDDDGCPDPDNDKDGIKDKKDKCPNKPEDKDRFQDKDGCPDPDNDGDGIKDVDDVCPDKPEDFDEYEDEDGCPEKGSVRLRRGRIDILEKVYFRTGKSVIKKRSYKLLNDLARLIIDNPRITKLRVEGHTDDRGPDDYNMRLSQSRATSVRNYLVGKGVKANILIAKGFGETQPIAKNKSKKGRAKNRRVEFIILEIHGETVPQPPKGKK